MMIRAIDIRYNLEFTGLKTGVKRYEHEYKLRLFKGRSKEKIQNEISNNGCPCSINKITSQNFSKDCSDYDRSCKNCWKQVAEE